MRKRLFVVALCCLAAVGARAYDFSAVVASGQTLYFNIVGGGVEVTYPNSNGSQLNGWNGFTQPSGALTIPALVTHQGTTYPVVAVAPFAFYNCGYISSLTVEEGVISLGNSAFNYCESMQTVTLPASVDSIGSQTFGRCYGLTSVTLFRATPPVTNNGAFYNTTLTSCMLYVPCGSDSLYSATAPWSAFGTVLTMACSATVATSVNDPARGYVTGGDTYPLGSSVTLTAVPVQGYAFICWNDGDTLNPRMLTVTEDLSLVAMFFALLHDTVVPESYTLQVGSAQESLGVGVGTTRVSSGTDVEICALPLEGARFAGWSDGSTANPRRVTVTESVTYTAFFEQLSAASPEAREWRVHCEGREVVVDCASGSLVGVYDASGRCVGTAFSCSQPLRLAVPAAGVYVVRVGETGAVKVTVE